MTRELRLSVSDAEVEAIEAHGGLRTIVDAAIQVAAPTEKPFRVSRKKSKASDEDDEEDESADDGDEEAGA